jgi:hypothetical protein
MGDDRDWDPGEPAAFSFLYENATASGRPEHHATWLQTLRVPLIALALGVFLAYVGPVPMLGALIIVCATFAALVAAIMHLVGG